MVFHHHHQQRKHEKKNSIILTQLFDQLIVWFFKKIYSLLFKYFICSLFLLKCHRWLGNIQRSRKYTATTCMQHLTLAKPQIFWHLHSLIFDTCICIPYISVYVPRAVDNMIFFNAFALFLKFHQKKKIIENCLVTLVPFVQSTLFSLMQIIFTDDTEKAIRQICCFSFLVNALHI